MESGVFLPALDHFMLSPLVTWVSSARGSGGGMLRFPDAHRRAKHLTLSHPLPPPVVSGEDVRAARWGRAPGLFRIAGRRPVERRHDANVSHFMPALFSSFVCQMNNLGCEQMEEAQISILCFDSVDWHPSRSHLF